MSGANIKLVIEKVPGVGECVGLFTTEKELFITPDRVLDLVDALLVLHDKIESKKAALKRPVLRVVGGKNAIH